MNWYVFALAAPQGGENPGNPMAMFIPIIGMVVIFYLLLIRPQQKRQKETQKMLEAVKKGDRIVTSSGIYGTVHGIKDNIVVVKIAENVKVEMLKSSITGVVNRSEGNG